MNKQISVPQNNLLSLVSPTTIGFNRLFDDLARLHEAPTTSYPPHNIVKVSDNIFRIEMAIAGFKKEDINIVKEKDELTISGVATSTISEDEGEKYLHKGIAAREFSKSFKLADHTVVQNAWCTDGLLCVSVVLDIPEEEKPQQISIL